MRLIDADALKFRACTEYDCKDKPCEDCLDQYITKREIDNAPTVDTTCPNCDSGYAQGYSDGYLKGKEERPQGEWIEKVERRGCFAGDKAVYSYTCPFCGAKEFKKYPFCHCGADMRKENAENE